MTEPIVAPTQKKSRRIPKVWIFPIVVLIVWLLFTGLRISGTSEGAYGPILKGTKDPNLIVGSPKGIRSDEFIVNTQLAISQKQNDFKRFNPNINGGEDTSVLADAPYREWSTVFRPQNISFFVMPFENAFAFKWWSLFVGLILTAYAFSLKFLPKRIFLAVLFSIIVSFTPFVFWWYLTGTIGPLFYGFCMMLLGMSIIDKTPLSLFKKKKLGAKTSLAIKVLALSYVMVAFAIVLYPPFQVPVAIVVGFFTLGYFLENVKLREFKTWIGTVASFVLSAVIAVGTVFIFLKTRTATIHTITNTDYPGDRYASPGGYNLKRYFVTYLQPQLQRVNRGANYIGNQSESSSFIVTSQFFFIPSVILLAYGWIKTKKISWILLCLFLCNCVFMGHLYIHQFDPIGSKFQLNQVALERLAIGVGFLGAITMLWTVVEYSRLKITSKWFYASMIGYSAVYAAIALDAGFKTRAIYPAFITSGIAITGLCLIVSLGLTLLLTKPIWGFVLLALFSFASVYQVDPLYRGMGPVAHNNKVIEAIQSMPNKNATWAVLNSFPFENFPQMAGRKAITGTNLYPNIKFWQKYLKKDDRFIYNRYAHTYVGLSETDATLIGADQFSASVSCDQKLATAVNYLLTVAPIDISCATQEKSIKIPGQTLYIYSMHAGKK